LDNVVIVAQGNITLTGTAQLTNTVLVSLNGRVAIDRGTMEGTKIFSRDALTFSGNSANYVWNGSNTIATQGAITFNGANKNSNQVNPVTSSSRTACRTRGRRWRTWRSSPRRSSPRRSSHGRGSARPRQPGSSSTDRASTPWRNRPRDSPVCTT
ncbi:MAG: hypothetical protein ABR510_14950, partial [Trueperaceae bacterium]